MVGDYMCTNISIMGYHGDYMVGDYMCTNMNYLPNHGRRSKAY